MFELVFYNGTNMQYRKSEVYNDDFDRLLMLLDSCGLPFKLYFNKQALDYPLDLKILCRFVA